MNWNLVFILIVGIAVYVVLIWLVLRFFMVSHGWDEDISNMPEIKTTQHQEDAANSADKSATT